MVNATNIKQDEHDDIPNEITLPFLLFKRWNFATSRRKRQDTENSSYTRDECLQHSSFGFNIPTYKNTFWQSVSVQNNKQYVIECHQVVQ